LLRGSTVGYPSDSLASCLLTVAFAFILCRLSVTLCTVAKRCVLEQKLLFGSLIDLFQNE